MFLVLNRAMNKTNKTADMLKFTFHLGERNNRYTHIISHGINYYEKKNIGKKEGKLLVTHTFLLLSKASLFEISVVK